MQHATSDAFRPYQSDVLFLLLGTNPLPDYVAALLLAKEGGTVVILHTGSLQSQDRYKGTGQLATRLKRKLQETRPHLEVTLYEVDEVDGERISAKLRDVVRRLMPAGKTIGLNYSGGTKPMAVHTYRVLQEQYPNCFFSYLDARSLDMVIHHGDEPTQRWATGCAVELSLEDLLALHSYRLATTPIRSAPRCPELTRAIAQVCSSRAGAEQWANWLNTFGNQSAILLPPGDYRDLEPVRKTMEKMRKAGESVEDLLKRTLDLTLGQSKNFFAGQWLEEYTLLGIQQFAAAGGIGATGTGVVINRLDERGSDRALEIDVVAMRGYQLFAISCTTSSKSQEVKYRLMEVFVRARQLGGDESRCAVVSMLRSPMPQALQAEVEREWDAAGKIWVFGQQHMLELPAYLRNWFETANGEAR